ncbi:MAG: cell division protein FtsH, partial [Clostridia bacterium]|nr:cell division protein FtsH [Clostridia bacterium]
MQEFKKPEKNKWLIYYGVVLVLMVLLNTFVLPSVTEHHVKETDYGTFMTMTNEGNIGLVDIQDYQILFTDKAKENIYKTGIINDPGLAERLNASGAVFSSEIVQPASPIMSFLLSWILPFGAFMLLGNILSKKLNKSLGGGSMAFGLGIWGAMVYVPSSTGISFD